MVTKNKITKPAHFGINLLIIPTLLVTNLTGITAANRPNAGEPVSAYSAQISTAELTQSQEKVAVADSLIGDSGSFIESNENVSTTGDPIPCSLEDELTGIRKGLLYPYVESEKSYHCIGDRDDGLTYQLPLPITHDGEYHMIYHEIECPPGIDVPVGRSEVVERNRFADLLSPGFSQHRDYKLRSLRFLEEVFVGEVSFHVNHVHAAGVNQPEILGQTHKNSVGIDPVVFFSVAVGKAYGASVVVPNRYRVVPISSV